MVHQVPLHNKTTRSRGAKRSTRPFIYYQFILIHFNCASGASLAIGSGGPTNGWQVLEIYLTCDQWGGRCREYTSRVFTETKTTNSINIKTYRRGRDYDYP